MTNVMRTDCIRYFAIAAMLIVIGGKLHGAPQLHLGRYLGYVAVEGVDRKIGVTLDFHKVQPNDLALFPKLAASLKITPGGLLSQEYVTYTYEDITYDFSSGKIGMDSPYGDLVIAANMSGEEQSVIDGQVLVRSSGAIGSIHLVEMSDEPDITTGVLPAEEYKSLISGQYIGHCDGKQSILQNEVAKGMDIGNQARRGLTGYKISGRLGMRGEITGCEDAVYCVAKHYPDALFDIFGNTLIIDSSTNDTCSVSSSGLTCAVHIGIQSYKCQLTRESGVTTESKFYSRKTFIKPTSEQMKALPEPNPPGNQQLVKALGGVFLGHVHHDSTGLYQVMRIAVGASSTTNNPQNENLVFVSGALSLHFDGTLSQEGFFQQFEPRSFYLSEGFTLESSNSDVFVQIKEWRQGYISGVLFSHSFGRIGIFEAIKGDQLPELSGNIAFVPSVVGGFKSGTFEPQGRPTWSFDLMAAPQSLGKTVSTLGLSGNILLEGAVLASQSITSGSYDFFAGYVAWSAGTGRFISGKVKDRSTLSLFWSGAARWGVLMDREHNYEFFRRTN
ncbi:MAG: hypothetical protein NTV34_04670 [Proteobacteria bacterium]|nr:hypothetical protein [Pseudomonadota bacterium]